MIDPILMTLTYLSVFLVLHYYNNKLVDLYSKNKYYKIFVDTLYFIFNFVMLCLSVDILFGLLQYKYYFYYFKFYPLIYFSRLLSPLKIIINQLSGKKCQLKDLVINLSTIWFLILFINYNIPWTYLITLNILFLLC